jgi:ubiquinol-cytochrome c reductase iron-sulfur subunit
VSANETTEEATEHNRRDFLYIATGMAGAVGVAGAVWPFIDQLRPDASTLAVAQIDVDLSEVEAGMSITAMWRGKPVFIRNRTEAEIEVARETAIDQLPDRFARNANLAADAPADDLQRSAGEGRENWIIMIGVCTHLGCVPLGQAGNFDGWFCPCHGSHYDTSGRIRRGPAPENMHIPVVQFVDETTIQLG